MSHRDTRAEDATWTERLFRNWITWRHARLSSLCAPNPLSIEKGYSFASCWTNLMSLHGADAVWNSFAHVRMIARQRAIQERVWEMIRVYYFMVDTVLIVWLILKRPEHNATWETKEKLGIAKILSLKRSLSSIQTLALNNTLPDFSWYDLDCLLHIS